MLSAAGVRKQNNITFDQYKRCQLPQNGIFATSIPMGLSTVLYLRGLVIGVEDEFYTLVK